MRQYTSSVVCLQTDIYLLLTEQYKGKDVASMRIIKFIERIIVTKWVQTV